MLEEIFDYCLSLFSALTLDAPHLSREMNDNEGPSEQCIRYTWGNRVHTLFDQYIFHHYKQNMKYEMKYETTHHVLGRYSKV